MFDTQFDNTGRSHSSLRAWVYDNRSTEASIVLIWHCSSDRSPTFKRIANVTVVTFFSHENCYQKLVIVCPSLLLGLFFENVIHMQLCSDTVSVVRAVVF